ncbi:MAG: PAS domain S-box protein [Gemmatimonadetes bacterium]|nr:PAS domain S-box protein [Gemmatimonadota bacterium]
MPERKTTERPAVPTSTQDVRAHASQWLLFDTAPHGIVIHDAKGAIVDANAAAERMLGIQLAAVRGQVELDHLWAIVHEDGSPFPMLDQPPHVALRTAEPNGPAVLGIRVHGRPDTVWVSASAIPMRLPNQPRPFAALTMFVDITAARVAADALRESEERFKNAFRDSPVMMAISDFETGRFVDVNDRYCTVTGYTREQLVGQRSIDLGIVAGPTRDLLIAAMRDRGRVSNFEIPIHTRTGDDLTVMMSGDVLVFNGKPHLLTIATDVTARSRMEAERVRLAAHLRAVKRSERIGERGAVVVQQLNGVLTSMKAAAERHLAGTAEQGALRGDLEAIAQAGQRGLEVVRGLVDFIGATAGPATTFDLNALVRAEVAVLGPTSRRGVRIVADYEPSPLIMRGDREALGQSLLTLCLNAIDAIPAEGTLSVKTRSDADGFVTLTVSDLRASEPASTATGDANLAPFVALPDEASQAFGLSMVRATIEAHGGTWVIERAAGRGGRVVIRLPLAAGDATVDRATE